MYGSCAVSSWFPLSTSNCEGATASSVGGHQSAKVVPPEASNSNVTTKQKSRIPMILIVMSFLSNHIIFTTTNPLINVILGEVRRSFYCADSFLLMVSISLNQRMPRGDHCPLPALRLQDSLNYRAFQKWCYITQSFLFLLSLVSTTMSPSMVISPMTASPMSIQVTVRNGMIIPRLSSPHMVSIVISPL